MIRQNGKIVPEFRIERVKWAEHVDFIHFQFCQKKKNVLPFSSLCNCTGNDEPSDYRNLTQVYDIIV